jgi:hypothetical protein
MSELAVLKWHKEACYSITFAKISDGQDTGLQQTETTKSENQTDQSENSENSNITTNEEIVLRNSLSSLTVKQRRERIAKSTHWVAAGSKDGKISLWDIF